MKPRSFHLISFGYLHGDPPTADRVEDVRRRLRDPAAAKNILDLDGNDPVVQLIVQNTPGADELLWNLIAHCETHCAPPEAIAVGCAGGRHRAPSLINLLAEKLRSRGHTVTVEHRDIHHARVLNA